ncbi:sodium-coupled neutral amino acid transporter 7-like [Glandiceps talaboti]
MSVQQATLNDSVTKVYGEESPLLGNLRVGSYDRDDLLWSSSGGSAESTPVPPLRLLSSTSVDPSYRTGKNSVLGACFIMTKACVGAGILAFPAAYGAAGGILYCVIMQAICVLCAGISLIVLAYSSDKHQTVTFETAVASLCGNKVKMACLVVIMVYGLGGCITFLVVLGDQFDRVMELIFSDTYYSEHWYIQRRFTISITSVLFILPLCFPAKIEALKYSSFFGALANMYVTLIIIVQYYTGDYAPHDPVKSQLSSWTDVFVAVPVIFFAFQCHLSSVPIYCSLKKRTVAEYTKVVVLSYIVIFSVYTLTGVYGYLTFGDNVNANILLSYRSGDIKVTVARIMLVISILTAYPILHYCARAALQGILKDSGGMFTYFVTFKEKYFRISATLLWFSVTLLAALFIPDILKVISIVGSFASAFILFFPGLCLVQCGLQSSAKSIHVNRFLISLGFIFTVLGAFIFGESLTMAIMKNIEGS